MQQAGPGSVHDSSKTLNRRSYSRQLPLLPRGAPLFTRLPATAVVLSVLPATLVEGAVLAEAEAGAGLIVVRDGRVAHTLCIEESVTLTGTEAFARIATWEDARVTATRLTGAELELVEQQSSAEICYDDLRLEWTDWASLINDLRSRGGAYLVTIRTPRGVAATVVHAQANGVTFTRASEPTAEPPTLDQLVSASTGVIRVYRSSDQPAPSDARNASDAVETPRSDVGAFQRVSDVPPAVAPSRTAMSTTALAQFFGEPRPESPLRDEPVPVTVRTDVRDDVSRLLPDLKIMVRSRLRLSAGRIEALLDDAAMNHLSVHAVAGEIRAMSIRGVLPSTLEQLAGDMVDLAAASVA